MLGIEKVNFYSFMRFSKIYLVKKKVKEPNEYFKEIYFATSIQIILLVLESRIMLLPRTHSSAALEAILTERWSHKTWSNWTRGLMLCGSKITMSFRRIGVIRNGWTMFDPIMSTDSSRWCTRSTLLYHALVLSLKCWMKTSWCGLLSNIVVF